MVKKHKVKGWLLLIHQIPPKPDYFRVKIWRKLQKIGAVAVKQSVYVLPDTEQSFEDLHWVVKEIESNGGTASLSKTVFLEGLTDAQIIRLFTTARNADFEQLVLDLQLLAEKISSAKSGNDCLGIPALSKVFLRLQRRYDEITAIDFFRAAKRDVARDNVLRCQQLLVESTDTTVITTCSVDDVQGKVWVTRTGLYIDRISCIWLIKRFIDGNSQYKFIEEEPYFPEQDEIRFDMYEAEFTHRGDKCTFEVFIDVFGLAGQALAKLAQVIHDIDLKENKFNRPETDGFKAVFSGMIRNAEDDQQRLQRGMILFDDLYASFNGPVQS